MGKVVKSVLYGYAGAILAGLAVGILGVGLEMSEQAVAMTATPAGIVFGLLGLSFAWWRPALVRVKSR